MTEPSKWAQELASHVFLYPLDRDTRRNIAFVLDAARRHALEEAARVIECGEPAGARYYYKGLIHSLIDREPAP